MIENEKLSHEQASSVLKERYPGVWGLSTRSVIKFCNKESVSSKVPTEKMTEMAMNTSRKVIYAFS